MRCGPERAANAAAMDKLKPSLVARAYARLTKLNDQNLAPVVGHADQLHAYRFYYQR
jgi:hypothetical protein